MIVELETLLDELARRHARGEPLDIEGTLLKAGDRADELAPLIEAFLERAPRRAPSADALAYVRSLDDPPMLRARVAKALRVDDVVDAILAACKLQPDARPRSGATTSSSREAFSTHRASQRRCGTRSPRRSAVRVPR